MRADLVAALLHAPPLLYLDEPTIGLDLAAKDAVRLFLRKLRENGTTLMLTTHDIVDIEQICERIVVIDQGRIILDQALSTVRDNLARERIVRFQLAVPAPELFALPSLAVTVDIDPADRRLVTVAFDRLRLAAVDVITAVGAQAPIEDLSIDEPSIEDVVRAINAGLSR
jgi:ABC-2 type transport system ATP-binding protein